ncbi:hypothetical protein ABIB62_002211 [Mucilaginibacter sp. UYP25]|uniref:DUF4302 domain-containing protein n=1 Tax=unclassified Mucilaginibacter TaxID=2617802 RepID=UPI00339A39EB
MKKYLIYSFITIALFASCKKGVDPAAGERPEERTATALKTYDDALTGAPYGWKAFLYPSGGSGFSFYMTFNTSNRVSMYADINSTSTQTSSESSYRLKAVLAPSLLFDTYNYMHILADPAPEVNGGTAGWGLYSDFEFTFDKLSGDSILLHGNMLKSQLILVKATSAEADAYKAKQLNILVNSIVDYTAANKNLYLQLGDDIKVQTTLNITSKVLSLNWVKDNTVSQSTSAFAFTLTGVVLKQPVVYEGKKITELTWDAAAKNLYTTVGGEKVVIQASPTPILPLHLLIGVSYNNIIVPNATNYAGWSVDFVTRRATAALATQKGPYGLRLDRMQFIFNVLESSLTVTVDIYQGNNKFLADFPYAYIKTGDGVYKFNAIPPTGNAGLIVNEMAPLTTQRIGADHFILDYFFDANTGQTLGQFKSVEHPDFAFTGSLN